MTPIQVRHSCHRRPGFLLVEILLGVAVFGLFLTAAALSLLRGQEGSALGGDRVRGVYAADRMLEATRSIRDGSFSSLTDGAHGVALDASKTWTFLGTKSVWSGTYITSVNITASGSDWVRLSANTRWKHGYNRSGSVILYTDLTNWRAINSPGDWSSATLEGQYQSGTPLFNALAVKGKYAFVTSETSSGGAGLYVFDISSTSSPSRVAAAFSLGTVGYGLAVRGNVLYVVTGDSSQEIRAYDITSPAALDASKLLTTYNLSGASLGLSAAVTGDALLVGTSLQAGLHELYSFNVSRSGSIRYVSSLDSAGDINGIVVSATGAYLATGDGAGEIKAVKVRSSGGQLSLPSLSDFNLTCTTGKSIALSGTSALLGCQKSASQEMILLNTANGAGSPPPSPGPWYHEGSGSLVGIGLDPAACYGFLAADSSVKAFQIVDIRSTASLPELWTYNSDTGAARGLFYDVPRDRVFVLTRTALLIFRPDSSAGSCS